MPQNVKEITDKLRAKGIPDDRIQSYLESKGLATGGGENSQEPGVTVEQTGAKNMKDFVASKQANKKQWLDDDGEQINLAEDFGETGALVESIPFIGDLVDDLYGSVKTGRAQARSVDDALNLFKEGADVDDDDLQEYLQRVKELEGRPPSKEMTEFNQIYDEAGGGAWGFVKSIALRPQAALETMASSLVAMANPSSAAGAAAVGGAGALTGSVVPGIGTSIGAVSGAMAGASATLDTAMSFTEFLQEEVHGKGLEFDEDGVRAILEDPEALGRIRTRAAARGAVIGLVDGLTGGIAGKVTKAGAKLGKSAAKAAGKGFAIEAAGGGAGEALGRVAAGQELDAREIGLEIVGEFGQAVPVVKTALKEAKPSYEINGNKMDVGEMTEFVNNAPEDMVLGSETNIKNDADLQAAYQDRLSKVKDINKDNNLLTQSDLDAKKSKLDNIKNLYKLKEGAESEATKNALQKQIDLERTEIKDLVKEQRDGLKGLSQVDRESIVNNNVQVQDNNQAISELEEQKKYDTENAASIDQAISRLKEDNAGLNEGTANIRAIQSKKVAKKKAQQKAKQQEEVVEQEAEEVGIDSEQYKAQQEEMQATADEEASDNGDKFKKLDRSLAQTGIKIESAEGSIDQNSFDTRIPLSKGKEGYSAGDFEKTISSRLDMDLGTAQESQYAIEDEADAIGANSDVRIVPGDEPGTFRLEGTISSPEREAPLSDKFKQEQEVAAEEEVAAEAKEVEKAEKAAAEEVVKKEAPKKEEVAEERTPATAALEYAQSEAKDQGSAAYKGEVKEVDGNVVYPGLKAHGQSLKEAGVYSTLGKLKKAGYADAKFESTPEGITLVPGEKTQDTGVDLSLDESQIPSITDQIKSENPGKITHQKARRLATERLREGVREIDRVKGLTPDAEDGATFNADGTKYEGGGLVVPVTSENLTQAELTPERIQAFKEKHKDKIGPATKVGIYKFPNSDKVSIDLNIVAPSSQRERALAIGKELGQESLFDLDTFENVKTGETGQAPKQITAEQAKQFADELGASPEFSLADRPLTKLLSPEEKKARRLEEQKEAQPPKKSSDPREKFDEIARIKPPSIPTPFAPPGTPAKGPVLQNPGVELRKTAEGEELADAFDRALVSGDPAATLREDLGKQPDVDDAFINAYNEGKLTNEDLIKSLANYVMGKSPRDKEVQGFALGKFVEEVIGGKFKDKNVRQVFSKAKSIASRAKTLQREAYGENRDYQRSRNVARRADQAFYAEHGRDPGYDELADYINENKNKYKIDITPAQVEEAFVEEVNIEQPGVQGEVRERAQDRAAREAGLDTVSGEVLNAETQDVVDTIVEGLVAQRPEIESEGKFQNLQPRKGASLKRAAEGDVAGKKVKTINTKIDQDIKNEIGKVVKGDQVSKAFAKFGKEFGFGDANYNSLDRAEKQKFRRRLIDGLAHEAEQRVGEGKPTPSPEFSLENRNPKFSGFEFDAGRTTSQRVEAAVKPFLQNSKRNLRGDKFSSVLTHRSPEKKSAVKRAAREVGANIVDHPLNPGEVLVLPQGKTLNDILKFNTSKNGKAIDLDPRDFTTFNESAKPDARQYTNLNINDLINNINSRSEYINNSNNWGKLNKIAQLQPRDINNIKRSLTEQGFNVEESVDAKGDPTIVFSKGKIDPKWSLEDVHAPSKEQASTEYIKSVSKALQNAFPNVDVISSQEGFNNAVSELQRAGHYLPAGVKGMQYANKVVINPSIATKDTPIHEFGHIWASQLQKTNPKLWKRGVELLKGSPYMRVVADIPHYKAYLKESPSKFYEEVMANALGKRGAEIFARNTEKAGAWDHFMKGVGKWIKDKLNIASEKDYADLTLDDWLNLGASSILTGDQTAFAAPVSRQSVSYNLGEINEEVKRDKAADWDAGTKAEPKWYKPKDWGRLLVPPAADDYHGLLQRAKLEKYAKPLTDAFVRNHHKYVNETSKVRKAISDNVNELNKSGIKLHKRGVAEIKGKKLNAAQAIQAHVDGFPTKFSTQPAVQRYINKMTQLGVLKANRDSEKGYLGANPSYDTVDYIANDLYQTTFQEFNALKANTFGEEKMNEISRKNGPQTAKALDNALARMSTGKSGGFTDPATGPWNDFLLGSVGVTMFFNGRSAALQTISSLNYGFESKNPIRFTAELARIIPLALTGKNKEFNTLWNSPYLKERRARAGVDVTVQEMADLAAGGTYGDFVKKLLNFGFKATTLADSFAIASGGVALARSNKVAVDPNSKQWIESSEEAQQSARPDRVSQWQAGSVAKYVLAFANTPQQYFRLSQKAVRSIREGKDVKKNVGKLIYYMGAQNALFTTLQSATYALIPGIEEDKDEKDAVDAINSISESILRGMGLYGAIINTIKNIAVEGYKQENFERRPDHVKTFMKGLTISPPLQHKIRNLEGAGKALNRGDVGTAVAKAGAVANLPTDWALKKFNAAKQLNDDKYNEFQKSLLLLGWSEYNFDYGK